MFLQAAWMLPPLSASIRLFGYRRTLAWLTRLGGSPPEGSAALPASRERLDRAAELVAEAAGYHRFAPTCLPKSLCLWWLLRRRGVEVALRVGVRKRDGRLEAHAWVEHEGRFLRDRPDSGGEFAPFERPFTPRAPG